MGLTPALLATGGIAVLAACFGAPAALNEVDFSASSAVTYSNAQPMLTVSVRATNPGPSAVTLEWGGCGYDVTLVDEAKGRPVWSYAALHQQRCVAAALQRIIVPGHSEDLPLFEAPVAFLLGDSLPPGRYHVTVRTAFRDLPSRELPAGTVTLNP